MHELSSHIEAEKIQIIKDQNLILAENGTAFSEDSNIEIEANKCL